MKDPIKEFGFSPENYRLLFVGLGINVLGFLLMIGGASEDPNQFDGDALFSHMRITVAPILIAVGYGIIIYSIMKKPSSLASNKDSQSEVEDVESSIKTTTTRKKKGRK